MTGSGRLLSLTGLRFVAAFIVFLSHATGPLTLRVDGASQGVQRFAGQGYVGVSFFFVLSGFVMTWSHRDGDTPAAFWRRRVARIAPAYWVALVAGTAVTVGTVGHAARELVRAAPSVPALQAWVPCESVYFGGNGVGWSLSVEAFFYLLFPLLILRAPTTLRTCAVSAVALVAWPVLVAAVAHPTGQGTGAYWVVYVLPIQRLAEFALGIVVARSVQLGWRPPLGLAWSSVAALVACVATAFAPYWLTFVAITIVPFAWVIAAAAQADGSGRSSWFRARWLVRLGEWSFSFYLVHQIVVRVEDALIERAGPPGYLLDVVGLVAAFVVSIAAAAALYYLVERPCERRLRGARPRREMTAPGT